VHRCDGSGTTRVLCEYLSLHDPAWQRCIGFFVSWPKESRFQGATGSDGVARAVGETEYSIGYIEYTYALINSLDHASILNNAGQYKQANTDTIGEAISDLPKTDDAEELARAILKDGRKHHDAYPITALTWIVMPIAPRSGAMRVLLGPSGFFPWTMTEEPQGSIGVLGYVKLSTDLAALEQREINR
jgi:ABC-type phosphate transport system substrate-binding protein